MSAAKITLGARGRPRLPEPEMGQHILTFVPAHNESGQIGACVRSILDMEATKGTVRLIVIADNCSDDTADEARRQGAEVWERTNLNQPGKPQAIQWALDQVDLADLDAVLIIDADTEVKPDFVRQLADSGSLRDRAVQAYYALQDQEGAWSSMLGGLLGQSKYEGQYQFRAMAKLNVPMTGNGMCMGSEVLKRHGWASDALTENWEMYARLTLGGERIDLAVGARLESAEPRAVGDSSVRRQRWQAGKWHVLKNHFRDIVLSPRIGFHQRIDLLAELLSPGPVVHAGIGFALGLSLIMLASTTMTRSLGILLLISPFPTIIWTARAIMRHPHPMKVLWAMARLPFYLVWRITIIGRALPTYLSGVWQRSPRTGDS